MTTRILITGSGGILGHALADIFQEGFEVLALPRKELDISDETQVRLVLDDFDPQVLINAAAYTKVDDCEKNREYAFLINGSAVGQLAAISCQRKIRMVHFSTDYVFDGTKKTLYEIDDVKAPINGYGESKSLGEDLLFKNCRGSLLIRSSWIYGKHGANFVDKILELAESARAGRIPGLKVVDDQVGSPTYAVDLAQMTKALLRSDASGVFHATNSGTCSWYEFAVEILRQSGYSDVKIEAVSSQTIKRPARRPAYSVLSLKSLERRGLAMRNWSEALGSYLRCQA